MNNTAENAEVRATAPAHDPDVVIQSQPDTNPVNSPRVVPRDEFFEDVTVPEADAPDQSGENSASVSERSDATGDLESSVLI